MNRKKYNDLHREYRELQRAFATLYGDNEYESRINQKARNLIIIRQGEILGITGCCYCKNYDYLNDGGREYMGKRNRMTGHPTPNLKGI